ncbi:hypothetical protein [Insolitispirillum peregrinum]|uniref:hypothetical protein n=1 Tax=Insolitispirillum peregrinum TaxID=80876 RepID=UPI0036125848
MSEQTQQNGRIDLLLLTMEQIVSHPVAHCLIEAVRHPEIGPIINYYKTPEDARNGNIQILDIWDRESWREGYRHARLWRVGGLAHRVLKGE